MPARLHGSFLLVLLMSLQIDQVSLLVGFLGLGYLSGEHRFLAPVFGPSLCPAKCWLTWPRGNLHLGGRGQVRVGGGPGQVRVGGGRGQVRVGGVCCLQDPGCCFRPCPLL